MFSHGSQPKRSNISSRCLLPVLLGCKRQPLLILPSPSLPFSIRGCSSARIPPPVPILCKRITHVGRKLSVFSIKPDPVFHLRHHLMKCDLLFPLSNRFPKRLEFNSRECSVDAFCLSLTICREVSHLSWLRGCLLPSGSRSAAAGRAIPKILLRWL